MHDHAGCIATKTHRDCKQEGTWDCNPPQTDSTVKSAAAIHAYFGQKITLLSLILRWWKNFIVRQNIFSSGSMCRCILLDKIVHDKHNNKLHWTRVGQTIMQNYAQLCTCIIPPPCPMSARKRPARRPKSRPPTQPSAVLLTVAVRSAESLHAQKYTKCGTWEGMEAGMGGGYWVEYGGGDYGGFGAGFGFGCGGRAQGSQAAWGVHDGVPDDPAHRPAMPHATYSQAGEPTNSYHCPPPPPKPPHPRPTCGHPSP